RGLSVMWGALGFGVAACEGADPRLGRLRGHRRGTVTTGLLASGASPDSPGTSQTVDPLAAFGAFAFAGASPGSFAGNGIAVLPGSPVPIAVALTPSGAFACTSAPDFAGDRAKKPATAANPATSPHAASNSASFAALPPLRSETPLVNPVCVAFGSSTPVA